LEIAWIWNSRCLTTAAPALVHPGLEIREQSNASFVEEIPRIYCPSSNTSMQLIHRINILMPVPHIALGLSHQLYEADTLCYLEEVTPLIEAIAPKNFLGTAL
jgi:hypothetical protein